MDGLYLISCLAIIVLVVVFALIIVILSSNGRKKPQPTEAQTGVVVNETTNRAPQYNPQNTAATDPPQMHLERSKEYIARYNMAEAKKHALAAFRSGDSDVRLQAIKLLHALHEVEQF